MPGRSYAGRATLSGEERALALRLGVHVATLAAAERNVDLETSARYIEAAFRSIGLEPQSTWFESRGRKVRNITAGSGSIVIGAHYDTVPGSPGADDNASGVAVLIELARLGLPARFIAFANEELPYSHTMEMGSFVAATASRERGESIDAMFSLEMLGCYNDAPGTQRYPWPLNWLYPDRADFIAFVGDVGARRLVRSVIAAFRRHARLPSQGVAAPSSLPGVTASDHWSYRRNGYPAVMVTDTAFNRYPHYHRASDTAEKLDYERMALATVGLAAAIKEIAAEHPHR